MSQKNKMFMYERIGMIVIALILVIIISNILFRKLEYRSTVEFESPESIDNIDTLWIENKSDTIPGSDTIINATMKKRARKKSSKKQNKQKRPTPRNHRDEVVS